MIKQFKNYETSIACPFCGKGYEICDIYIPEELTGKKFLVRDSSNKIIGIKEEVEQNLDAFYICDECNEEFKVSAKLAFMITPLETKSLIKQEFVKQKIKLDI